MSYRKSSLICLVFALVAVPSLVLGQATEFTYQGQMQSGGAAANGSFDLEFSLFDAAAGGSQVGSTLARSGVAVANGIFAVNLDFGQNFTGANRFLEIRVRPAGGGAFTTLSPRQPLGSSPYSIRSLAAGTADNATTATTAANISNPLGGDVTGAQSNTTVARLRGRNVSASPPNNGHVLKFNSATSQWEPANDETATSGGGGTITGIAAGTGLTGGGTTGSVTLAIQNGGVNTSQLADGAVATAKLADNSVTDAKIVGVSGAKVSGAVATATNASQLGGIAPTGFIQNSSAPQPSSNFNISGTGTAAILSANNQYNIGAERVLSTPGLNNLFIGINAGTANTSGGNNNFFGRNAGASNTVGGSNLFFGGSSGAGNTTGSNNSFFGHATGVLNTTGSGNTFIGVSAGNDTTTGGGNVFVGANSGIANTSGSSNTFIGSTTGLAHITGSRNALFGAGAEIGSPNLSRSTAIGADAMVSQSNSIVLGAINGINGSSVDTNVGIGTSAPSQRLHVVGNGLFTGNLSVGGTLTAPGFVVPAGSSNYIHNATTQQTLSNFNISGSGSAATFSATSDFRIGGTRILHVPGTQNTFVGSNAGVANPSPSANSNSFFGFNAGPSLTTGSNNSFFGARAGELNATGSSNSFFGVNSGDANTGGSENSFFGHASGGGNTTGNQNSAFGRNAGQQNATGSENSYFGFGAGQSTSSSFNAFYGSRAGQFTSTGGANSFFGASSGLANNGGGDNSFYGVNSGLGNVSGNGNSFFGRRAGQSNISGSNNTIIGNGADVSSGNLNFATAIGAGAIVTGSNQVVIGRQSDTVIIPGALGSLDISGFVDIGSQLEVQQIGFKNNLDSAGAVAVCWTLYNSVDIPPQWDGSTYFLTRCGSSIKLKTDVRSIDNGIGTLTKLRPVFYRWKRDGTPTLGLIAEEVNEVDPNLAQREADGTVFGVNFDAVTAVLIKSVQEQQQQIETQRSLTDEQQRLIRKQRAEIDELRVVVCSLKPDAALCGKK